MSIFINNNQHDEDEMPTTSLSGKFSNEKSNLFTQNDDRTTKTLENWRNLYETSVRSLRDYDEDEIDPHSIQRNYSPIEENRPPPTPPTLPENSNESKFRWKINLPELLDSSVGPDRQKRDINRRHTTNIVFQNSQSNNYQFTNHSNDYHGNQPTNSFVRRLTQKFDQIIADHTAANLSRPQSQTFPERKPRIFRVSSLTGRNSATDNNQRLRLYPRSALPVRPSTGIPIINPRMMRNLSSQSQISLTNIDSQPYKKNPPISYLTKHLYPPPAPTSVVKQLLDRGATLVYDSSSQENVSKTKESNLGRHKMVKQLTQQFTETNSDLAGRNLTTNSDDGYAKIQKGNLLKKNKNDEDVNYYEQIISSTEKKTNQRHSSESDDGDETYYPVLSPDQWEHDNQN